MTKFHT